MSSVLSQQILQDDVVEHRVGQQALVLGGLVFQRLREHQEDSAERRRIWTWTRMAAARPEIEVREMACALLDGFWRDHRKDVVMGPDSMR